MGFFSSLLEIVAPVVGAIIGVPAAPIAAPAVTAPALPTTNIAKGLTPPAPAMTVATLPSAKLTEVPISQLISPPVARGGTKNRIETRILTIMPNGTVINVKVLDGAPWLMRKDFIIMKRVIRTLSRGEKRIPKKRTRSTKDAEELALMKGLVKGLIASGGHHGHGGGVTVVDT